MELWRCRPASRCMTMSATGSTNPSAEKIAAGVVLRRVSTPEEYDMCIRMQHEIWGDTFTEVVPSTILRVTQRIGGVTAGAFDADGRLLGFVFGMTGTKDGSLVHWSDLLAVHPEARNKGLGLRLKLFQRELLISISVKTMFWTYDPLVAKNAYLNFVKLGARPVEYVVNMYGGNTKSELHGSLGTDRLIVSWDLTATATTRGKPQAVAGSNQNAHSPIVNRIGASDASYLKIVADLPDVSAIRIEIPADIHSVIDDSFDRALEWRAATRRAFTHYLSRDYRVTDFTRDPMRNVYYYTLTLNAA